MVNPETGEWNGPKGPEPTRVKYALAIPTTACIFVGPTPEPEQAAPETVFEEVTKGYVP